MQSIAPEPSSRVIFTFAAAATFTPTAYQLWYIVPSDINPAS